MKVKVTPGQLEELKELLEAYDKVKDVGWSGSLKQEHVELSWTEAGAVYIDIKGAREARE